MVPLLRTLASVPASAAELLATPSPWACAGWAASTSAPPSSARIRASGPNALTKPFIRRTSGSRGLAACGSSGCAVELLGDRLGFALRHQFAFPLGHDGRGNGVADG